jgi:asparagine synthase (glutamine-hydrolysing)
MSGIVGIVNRNVKPIDSDLLQQMTQFMSYRGPDAQKIWMDDNVGFGHTMLRTTRVSLGEEQPFSLDGEVWITADARIDGRRELTEKLKIKDSINVLPDAELILRAYYVWGEDCVQYLLGDFAFGIWDGRKKRLFCARDHFGLKPFYYAEVENCLIFSNTLNCLRIHPGVSDELNDLAIADFLLFGYNQEFNTTSFADIQRLPPAHCLTWSGESLHIKRYWTLPTDGYIRYKKASDYVEHFRELIETAVSDRLRSNQVGIFMSGGMDSSSIAATAQKVLLKQSESFDLRAYTVVYDKLIPDRERYYSGLVAETLNIPIHYLPADDYKLFESVEQPEFQRPEPTDLSFLAISKEQFQRVASHSRVVLDGNGGDPVFYSWGAYFHVVHLLKKLEVGQLVSDVVEYVRSHKRLPQPGLRSRVKRWLGIRKAIPPFPEWINPELSAKLDLPAKWEQFNQEKPLLHPIRPEAYHLLTLSLWPCLFESYDPGVTGFPLEVRYPFFDLRLVNYLLAIPPVPWCLHKELLRVAMEGYLPESVRQRPKSPLVGDRITPLLPQPGLLWKDGFAPTLTKYVKQDRLLLVNQINSKGGEIWRNLYLVSLNYWLQGLKPINFKRT